MIESRLINDEFNALSLYFSAKPEAQAVIYKNGAQSIDFNELLTDVNSKIRIDSASTKYELTFSEEVDLNSRFHYRSQFEICENKKDKMR